MTPDQAQGYERDAALMAVAHALTDAQSVECMHRFKDVTGLSPAGMTVADVLDCTTDHDMFLDQTEPFLERFARQMPQDVPLSAALHAVILLGKTLTPGRVIALLQRAGMTEVPRYPEVEVGLRVRESDLGGVAQVSDANHLVLKARAEQGMRAAGVPEAGITEFRASVRETGIPGFSRSAADIAAWVTLVDRTTAMSRKVYDPVHDLAVVLAWADFLGGPDGGEVRLSLDNLRSHLDMRDVETIKSSLFPFHGKGPTT